MHLLMKPWLRSRSTRIWFAAALQSSRRVRCLTYQKPPDTVGEITIRRQKPLVLRIMVEQGRTMILFLSELTPRCEQIFPHRCCFQPVRRIRQQCPNVCATTADLRRSTRACVVHNPPVANFSSLATGGLCD